jgi:hypothetical protein
MAGYTEEELREAIRDKQSPVAKIGAAVAWTFAISQGLTRTGSPVFLPVLQEIADRTDGKTHQQISIQTTTTTIGVDLTKLSVDQLKALQAIVAAQHGDKASKQLDMIDMATDGKAIT